MKKETQVTFQQVKKLVQKKYPEAHTQVDSQGKYYVADKQGRDISNLNVYNSIIGYKSQSKEQLGEDFFTTISKEPQTPHANSVREAWNNTLTTLRAHHILKINSERFNDDKVNKKNLME